MLRAEFLQNDQGFRSVSISGHAGFADAGEDIVCAAVTSAFQLVANGITEILVDSAEVTVGEEAAGVLLSRDPPQAAIQFLTALHLHLTLLQQQYPDTIELIISEV